MNKEIISMANKSSKREKDDVSVESRIMTRTTRYRINEKVAIDKKKIKHVIMRQYKSIWKREMI